MQQLDKNKVRNGKAVESKRPLNDFVSFYEAKEEAAEAFVFWQHIVDSLPLCAPKQQAVTEVKPST